MAEEQTNQLQILDGVIQARTYDHADSQRDLRQYYCRAGFEWLALWDADSGAYNCCPEWMGINLQKKVHFEDGKTSHEIPQKVSGIWFGENAERVKTSLLDGSFKYCNHDCPHLQMAKFGAELPENSMVIKKPEEILSGKQDPLKIFPRMIFLNVDRACNLSCPSCRSEKIKNSSENSAEYLKLIDEEFSAHVEHFHCTGAGDPFYSRPIREWMLRLDLKRYKKLKNFFIHSNGILWTKEIWQQMEALRQLYVEAEISIDAATEKTYGVVRRGGRWDMLLKNLDWMCDDPVLKGKMRFSFVVQDINFREMLPFINFIRSRFEEAPIEFRKLQVWPNTDYDRNPILYKQQAIHIPSHPRHRDFLNLLTEVNNKHCNIIHNFHDLQISNLKWHDASSKTEGITASP